MIDFKSDVLEQEGKTIVTQIGFEDLYQLFSDAIATLDKHTVIPMMCALLHTYAVEVVHEKPSDFVNTIAHFIEILEDEVEDEIQNS